mgnify:CR=1 FL=1
MTPLKKVLFYLKFELEKIIFFWVGECWKECFTYRSLFNYAFRILIFSVICIDVFSNNGWCTSNSQLKKVSIVITILVTEKK